jgi:methylthioribose-1-phosphate isomerase
LERIRKTFFLAEDGSAVENFFNLRTVSWKNDRVLLIDQTKLPLRLVFREIKSPEEMAEAIRTMVVRGAPAIGVAAAMGIALAALRSRAREKQELIAELEKAASILQATRPTAVNLFWGVERMLEKAKKAETEKAEEVRSLLVSEAVKMEEEDLEVNRKLGRIGSRLIDSGDTILTQCNAGALATVGYGTALGVVRAAVESGKIVKVIVPETRPQLQGSRLTAFELKKDGIECRIIPDTAVGYVMQNGYVDKVIVGADRITSDGYVFNKIGTYQMAVLSKRHDIPFFAAAPHSSVDMKRTSEQVTIEERSSDEVVKIRGKRVAAKGVPVLNPAFDKTPPELVKAIITDLGIVESPVEKNLRKFF